MHKRKTLRIPSSLVHKKTVRAMESPKPHKIQKDDICNSGICETELKPASMDNLLPREMMPQFTDVKEMKSFHKKMNQLFRMQKHPLVRGKLTMVPLSKLQVSQREIRTSRCKEIADAWKEQSKQESFSSILSSSPMLTSTEMSGKHAIVDGHHRLMAARLLSESGHISPHAKIRVYVMHAPVNLLLSAANALGKNKNPQEF